MGYNQYFKRHSNINSAQIVENKKSLSIHYKNGYNFLNIGFYKKLQELKVVTEEISYKKCFDTIELSSIF